MGGEEQALTATEEACRVYVGNLLPKAKEVHLTSKFSRFGTIHSVWIARRPPGFAFVRFATPDAAQRAVNGCQEDGSMEILGKAVRVQMAGDKDMKNSTSSQKQTSSSCKIKGTDSSTPKRDEYDRGRRSRFSRGHTHSGRSRSRESSGRRSRRSRSPSYCRDRRASQERSRSRSARRKRSRSHSSRRGTSRSRSRSRDRRRHARTGRRRSRSSRR
ncbi:hypothetical protein DVH05_002838 [Phytophthora capsici]|nr:hypothetical protein DVH05_002838 [Phytophthora capsici]